MNEGSAKVFPSLRLTPFQISSYRVYLSLSTYRKIRNSRLISLKSIMKYELQPTYQLLVPLVKNIKKHLEESSKILHDGNNKVHILSFKEVLFVIKIFKATSFNNRLSLQSKAKKNYKNSLKYWEICPEAVGYIDYSKSGFILNSYYISHHYNYDFTLKSVIDNPVHEYRVQILESFSKFIFQLHKNGISHKDYSQASILIKKRGNYYQFKILDMYRISAQDLELEQRIANIAKLMVDNKTMKIIIEVYAMLVDQPRSPMLVLAIQYRNEAIRKNRLRNQLSFLITPKIK